MPAILLTASPHGFLDLPTALVGARALTCVAPCAPPSGGGFLVSAERGNSPRLPKQKTTF